MDLQGVDPAGEECCYARRETALDRPAMQILTFRLVEGDPSDVRHPASIEVPAR